MRCAPRQPRAFRPALKAAPLAPMLQRIPKRHFRVFSRLFGKPRPKAPPSTGGRLVFAVGDVHGRLDVLEPLVADIRKAVAEPSAAAEGRPLVVFLGDYVDRGPASSGV